jgi:cellulose synthase/poly-beta-1,6-N-acetylglucosamine synthase-like glycosyltransferase
MLQKLSRTTKKVAIESAKFFVPTLGDNGIKLSFTEKSIAVLIPTHIPTIHTYNLIHSIKGWHPNVLIVVVDDCTPLNPVNQKIINRIVKLADQQENIIYLRTPNNALKAAALNYGIQYLKNFSKKPNVVFTFDDDVMINKDTIPVLARTLYEETGIGAVCSQVRVKNKNKNLLTRLQALEYHGFNITKISDNNFLYGPLVMQGMLTAFRMTALEQVNGFTHGHLIEDYDITARLKAKGWKVKIAHGAYASTSVPEDIEHLWKQRVRWTSGGLHVLKTFWKNAPVVYQDLIGHLLFITLLTLIGISFFFLSHKAEDSELATALMVVSLFNFAVAFSFNLYTLTIYPQRDKQDIALKLSILPELIYSNVLSLILIGSYLFFIYKSFPANLLRKMGFMHKTYHGGLAGFNKVGFSSTWGTKKS